MTSHLSLIKKLSTHFGRIPMTVVGGAIRDRLLNRPFCDIDLVVQEKAQTWAQKASEILQGPAFPLDEERGVYRVTSPSGFQVDFSNIQGKDFDTDLDRRDFTINALSVPLEKWGSSHWKKSIQDRHKGLKDLSSKKIRHIQISNLKEDPLRLLRAFRFSAELGFSIDPKTLRAIQINKNLIKKSAPERIREEWLKMFAALSSTPQLLLMEKVGLLSVLFPEAKKLRQTAFKYYGRGGVLKHTLDSVKYFEEVVHQKKSWFPSCHKKIDTYLNQERGGVPRVAHLKWAALLHDVGKPATAKKIKGRLRFFDHEHVGAEMVKKWADRYRWSSEETLTYAKLVQNHMRPGNLASHSPVTDKAIHRFFRDLGEEAIGMLLISLGDHLTYLTAKERKKRATPHEKLTRVMVNRFYQNRKKILPPKILDGHDIMKAFQIKPSKLIGQMLKDLQEAQSEGKIQNRDQGLSYLRGKLQEWEKTGIA